MKFLLFCMPLLMYATDGEQFRRCFEPEHIKTAVPAAGKRYYKFVQAVHTLEDCEQTVFQVGLVSACDSMLAQRLQKKIASRLHAMQSKEDCLLLADAQEVQEIALARELPPDDPRRDDVEYVQHQFFFNHSTQSFETAVPKLLAPKELQDTLNALPSMESSFELFTALKEFVASDFAVQSSAGDYEIPVVLIEEEVCRSAAGVFRLFYAGD